MINILSFLQPWEGAEGLQSNEQGEQLYQILVIL